MSLCSFHHSCYSSLALRQRDAMVFDCTKQHDLPIAAVPGGGSRREWQQLIPLHLSLLEETLHHFG